jgi:ferrous iron transport protein B
MSAAQPVRLALVGNPNCGKTALFNRLTGARQKVANYAGVTVERKEGQFTSPAGRPYQIVDLPGAYSLNALTPDEAITRDVLLGARTDEALPDLIVLVADATNLRLNLRLVLEILRLQRPTILVLNMMDMARKRGLIIDTERLKTELGIPVVETVAVQSNGTAALVRQLEAMPPVNACVTGNRIVVSADNATLEATQREVRRILDVVVQEQGNAHLVGDRIDAVVLHPVLGYSILAAILFLIFQAVFSWSAVPMELIKEGVNGLGQAVQAAMPEGILRSLLVDGILSGVGSVLVFLPQILILFLFILVLEDSFLCCPALRARFPASWPRGRSRIRATGWRPS